MNRGDWQATVHGVTKSQTRLKQLSTHTQPFSGLLIYKMCLALCSHPGILEA